MFCLAEVFFLVAPNLLRGGNDVTCRKELLKKFNSQSGMKCTVAYPHCDEYQCFFKTLSLFFTTNSLLYCGGCEHNIHSRLHCEEAGLA